MHQAARSQLAHPISGPSRDVPTLVLPAARAIVARMNRLPAPAPVSDPSTGASSEIVLLAVTGMSPAVLTETVWALAHEDPPWLPTRVIAITTALGRAEIERQLFTPLVRFEGQSPWDTLRAALAKEGFAIADRLRFGATADDIRVITAAEGPTHRSCELADLRSAAENEAAADFILEQVRGVVENPDIQVVASIAGGRKTMGALLYACLTLVGREIDRLTHVLVNEPFDTLREFFFPNQPGGLIRPSHIRSPRTQEAHDPATARVELAEVPFVPLRNLFTRTLGRKAGTFHRLMAACRDNVRQRAAESLRLTLDTARPEVEVNGHSVRVGPMEHLLMLFLARRAKLGEPAHGAYAEAVDDLNQFRITFIAEAPAKDFGNWRLSESLRAPWDEQEIRKAASRLRARFRELGGDFAILADCLPEKGRCSLDLPAAMLFLR